MVLYCIPTRVSLNGFHALLMKFLCWWWVQSRADEIKLMGKSDDNTKQQVAFELLNRSFDQIMLHWGLGI